MLKCPWGKPCPTSWFANAHAWIFPGVPQRVGVSKGGCVCVCVKATFVNVNGTRPAVW